MNRAEYIANGLKARKMFANINDDIYADGEYDLIIPLMNDDEAIEHYAEQLDNLEWEDASYEECEIIAAIACYKPLNEIASLPEA